MTGDMLKAIFKKQSLIIKRLHEKFPDRKMTYIDLIDAMSNECEELRDSFPWKKWKENFNDGGSIDWNNAKIEAVDLLFFLVEFFIKILDMNAKDVYRLYCKKHDENLKRYEEGY